MQRRIAAGRIIAGTALIAATLFAQLSTPAPAAEPSGRAEQSEAVAQAALAKLPLYFVENAGQKDSRVDFYVDGRDTSVYFTSSGITFALREDPVSGTSRRWAVKLDFVDAARVTPVGRKPTQTTVSYFKGSQDDWHAGLATYSEIVYRDLWPGIDFVYSSKGQALKYSFVVHPGGDPSDIRLAYRGAKLTRAADGRLRVSTPVGSFTDGRPFSYQKVGGRRVSVAASFALDGARGIGFRLGEYNPARALVIDPVVTVYAGYIGGAGDDEGIGIAIDGAGNAYVAGYTDSSEASFPVIAGPDATFNGGTDDAFVAKISADGTALTYIGYIGGAGDDSAVGIAVDSTNNAYVSGTTDSTEATFPVIGGPDLTFNGGFGDAFVAKLSVDGSSLVYAGYVGGAGYDQGIRVALDPSGSAYLTGDTDSTEATFPDTVGPDLTYNGGSADAFVAKVKADGSGLDYAGYIGGSGSELSVRIAVDTAGNAYVNGWTDSTEATFPVAVGPDLTYNGGSDDSFVAKVKADGTGLDYAGYIGGTGTDWGIGVAVDGSGSAFVTGLTDSTETTFPVLVGPDLTLNGPGDVYIAKIRPNGSALDYAGYIGGAGGEISYDVDIDAAGNAYVVGATADLPAMGGPDLTYNGGASDAFIAKVTPAGSGLDYAGYIGGSGDDEGFGIAVDPAGNAYVTGWTDSTEATFPASVGPDLTFNGGAADAFVAKVQVVAAPPPPPPPPARKLSVTLEGTGAGVVTGSGIDCGDDCTEYYTHSGEVTLTATAAPGSTFESWNGCDTIVDDRCTARMTEDRLVTATFDLIPDVAISSPDTHFQRGTSFQVSWSEGVNERLAGPQTYDLRYRAAPRGDALGDWLTHSEGLEATSVDFEGEPGFTYAFEARATGGEWSPEIRTSVPVDDPEAIHRGTWRVRKRPAAYGGTISVTRKPGARMTLGAIETGHLALWAHVGPRAGQVEVSWNGEFLARVNLRSETKGMRLLEIWNFDEPQRGRITIEVLSKGKPVRIDAIGVCLD